MYKSVIPEVDSAGREGFTVIELLVVIALIAILTSIGLNMSLRSKDRIKLRGEANSLTGKLHLLKQLASTENRNYRLTCTGTTTYATFFYDSATTVWETYEPVKTLEEGITIDAPLPDFIVSPGGFLLDPVTLRYSASQVIRLESDEIGNIEIAINTSGGIKIAENFIY